MFLFLSGSHHILIWGFVLLRRALTDESGPFDRTSATSARRRFAISYRPKKNGAPRLKNKPRRVTPPTRTQGGVDRSNRITVDK